MTAPSSESLTDLRHEIQRLLGQCLIRLQYCEKLLKSILTASDVSVYTYNNRSPTVTYHVETNGKTLGNLVSRILEDYLTIDALSKTQNGALPEDEGNHARMKFHLSLPAADFAQIQTSLRGLVDLRNTLVHHFIDGRDFSSLEGCQTAQSDLNTALATIGKHADQLQEIARGAETMRQTAQQKLSEFVQSDAFQAFWESGKFPWEVSDVVHELRAIAREVAVDGWVPLNMAIDHFTKSRPDRRPEDYGCRSWKQVLHTSRLFDLRYKDIEGQKVAMYRDRPRPTHH